MGSFERFSVVWRDGWLPELLLNPKHTVVLQPSSLIVIIVSFLAEGSACRQHARCECGLGRVTSEGVVCDCDHTVLESGEGDEVSLRRVLSRHHLG